MGYGKTLQNSIIIANTDYLITYDSDCTYDYNLIFYLLENIEKYNHDIINVSTNYHPKRLKFLFLKVSSWSSSFIYKIIP